MIDEHRLQSVLRESFGLDSFRTGQLRVIQRVLAGKNTAAVFPTGGGKSLCYQLPALLLDGLTLVVSPLMALMREQVGSLQARGIAAARLDSSLSPAELRETGRSVRAGELRLLYVAPERFFNERFRELIASTKISLLAVDEAHCISQWGHNFRPDYLKLASLAEALQVSRTLALTATATPTVLTDIREGFCIATEDVVQTPFHRPNLALRFRASESSQRYRQLTSSIKSKPPGATIIYVTQQKTTEELADLMSDDGIDAKAYHAGMEDAEREAIQDWFMDNENPIVVATIAFGMGVDKPNIRYVYHWNVSKGIESYAQEIGRSGRDGLPSHCEMFVIPEDRIVLENFAYGDTPTKDGVAKLIECIAHHPTNFYVSFYALSHECDIRDSVIRTLLTYLELDGYLEATGPRYDAYEFKPLVSSATILQNYRDEPNSFVREILSLSVKKKIWFELPLAIICERIRCERSRIVSMLENFSERGWMELKVSGLVHGYRRLREMNDMAALQTSLYDRLLQLEKHEIERIDQLVQFVQSSTCQAKLLAEYFGQTLPKPCGVCSACTGESIQNLRAIETTQLGSSAITQLNDLKKVHPDMLSEPRIQARFLCGLSSPLLVRTRLTRHPLFGCCREVPFAHVLKALERRA